MFRKILARTKTPIGGMLLPITVLFGCSTAVATGGHFLVPADAKKLVEQVTSDGRQISFVVDRKFPAVGILAGPTTNLRKQGWVQCSNSEKPWILNNWNHYTAAEAGDQQSLEHRMDVLLVNAGKAILVNARYLSTITKGEDALGNLPPNNDSQQVVITEVVGDKNVEALKSMYAPTCQS